MLLLKWRYKQVLYCLPKYTNFLSSVHSPDTLFSIKLNYSILFCSILLSCTLYSILLSFAIFCSLHTDDSLHIDYHFFLFLYYFLYCHVVSLPIIFVEHTYHLYIGCCFLFIKILFFWTNLYIYLYILNILFVIYKLLHVY